MKTVLRIAVFQLLIAASSTCAAEPQGPSVLVLLIDALRADHLGCYGYDRNTSPRLDTLAKESVLFVNAYAQSPWTKPSIPTLFTSLYPIQHGVYEGEAHGPAASLESDTLSHDFYTIAEAFKTAGFRTAAFVNNAHLPADHGFAQGFDVYEQGKFRAPDINRTFLEFVDQTGGRPFFAYLHYLDVHWPFRPSPPFDTRFSDNGTSALFDRDDWHGLRDRINDGSIRLSAADRERLVSLHDGGIAELDQQIGNLLDRLREQDLFDRVAILVTSDHGEELLDHGKVGHGGTLFDEVMQIPMMIRLPGGKGARRAEESARLLDVYPTLLRVAGIELPSGLEGRDLLGTSTTTPEIVSETRHKRTYRASLRTGDWKYIRVYRAPGVTRLASDRPETFGLQAGMRIKVKGWFGPDGSLSADKVTVKDANDDDLEVSGPVSELDDASKEFKVHVYRVVPTRKLLGREGGAILQEVQDGQWVKAEGDVSTGTTLLADKLEWLAPGDRKTELEGIVQQIEGVSGTSARAVVGNTTVIVSSDTRFKGGAGPTAPSGKARLAPGDDPFTPNRLLTGEGLTSRELLFDLKKDPDEQRNLAAVEAKRLAELRQGLRRWLGRMAQAGSRKRAGRARLDQESIERLRTLGYIE
jgi:arylsulfatase A-like enzyme